MSMLWTWQDGDISKTPQWNGDFEAALRGITCKALVLPGQTDRMCGAASLAARVPN